VLAAGEMNSAMIDGLEIVLCDASGIRRLSEESISKLKSGVAKRDEMISASLFDDRSPTLFESFGHEND